MLQKRFMRYMNKAKTNRNIILKMAVLFLLYMMVVGSAHAFTMSGLFGTENNSEKLKDIDEKVLSISGDMALMKFVNSNMFDQGVETIGVYITENDKVLRTYFIVRANSKSGVVSIQKDVPDKKGIWKFKTDIDQSIQGLDLAEEGFYLYDNRHSLETKSKIPYFVLRTLILYSGIDNENVPSLSEMIKKSTCGKCKKALNLVGFN